MIVKRFDWQLIDDNPILIASEAIFTDLPVDSWGRRFGVTLREWNYKPTKSSWGRIGRLLKSDKYHITQEYGWYCIARVSK